MTHLTRRDWLQKSLLASSAAIIAPALHVLESKPQGGTFTGFEELLKLNWNENPYGPSPLAIEAASEALKESNLYGDPVVHILRQKLADTLEVQQEEVMITAGSTEVLTLLGQHVGLLRGEVVTPWPSFPTLMSYAEIYGGSVKRIPLGSGDKLDLDAVADGIGPNTRLVFICNPNNPTGTEVSPADVREFVQSVPDDVLICVDEAYIEFSTHGEAGSLVAMVKEMPNLVVCRTFSKAYGLAGLRVGYAVSQEQNVKELETRHHGYSFNITRPSAAAALVALDDRDFMVSGVERNANSREIVYSAFDRWGVEYNPSSTNFIYASDERFVHDIVAKLDDRNIKITKWPIMQGRIRISLGTPAQMERFVGVLGEYLV